MDYRKKRGFTLVELLVVIAIISLLSSVVFASLVTARSNAQIAGARASLNEFRTAITFLEDDTGQVPGHNITRNCTISSVPSTNDFYLDTDDVGLLINDPSPAFPNWNGPYISSIPNDPWGNRYIFDDDYTCAVGVVGCNDIAGDTRVIHSSGPNGSAINVYDSDNIVLVLCRR